MLRRAARKTALFVVAVFAVGCLWELYKLIGPVDGGTVFGWRVIPKSSDRAMPHTWDMVARLLEPENRSGGSPIAVTVAGYSSRSLSAASRDSPRCRPHRSSSWRPTRFPGG
jgi:NitT/TauT family transport system permease protein